MALAATVGVGVGGMTGEAVEEVSVEVESRVTVGTAGSALDVVSRALPFIGNACPGDRRDANAVARMTTDALLCSDEDGCLTCVTAAARK